MSAEAMSLQDKVNENIIRLNTSDVLSAFKGAPTSAILKAISQMKAADDYQPATVVFEGFTSDRLYREFRSIADNVDFVQTALRVIETSIYRKKLIWKQKFACRCDICGWEYDHKVDKCENCQHDIEELEQIIKKNKAEGKDANKNIEKLAKLKKSVAVNILRTPNRIRMQSTRNWFESPRVSEFGQSGEQTLREMDRYKSIFDDGLLLAKIEYAWDANRRLVSKEMIAMEAIDVLSWDKNIDKTTKRMKDEYFCVYHRETVYNKANYEKLGHSCPQPNCGCEMFKAFHKLKDVNRKEIYYAQFEINHTMYFNPSKYRGRSPFFGMYLLVMSKIGMDRDVFIRYYMKQFPDSIIGLMTGDRDLEALKKEIIHNAREGLPQFVKLTPPTDNTRIQSPVVEFKLRDVGITELMNIDSRREIQNTVNRSLGIVPIASSDTEGTSALRGQGEQLTMLTSEIAARQENNSENIFPWLLELRNIDDYIIEYPDPAIDTEEQSRKDKVANVDEMVKMINAGFDAKLISKQTMEFEYEGTGTRAIPVDEEESFTDMEDGKEEHEEEDEDDNDNNNIKKSMDDSNLIHKAFDQKTYAGMSQDLTKVINREVKKGTELGQVPSQILLEIEKTDEWQSYVKKEHPDITLEQALEAEDYRLNKIIIDQGGKLDRERSIAESKEDDPSGDELKYDWAGRRLGDPRLSKECENILRAIPKEGATRNQIKKLVKQYGDPKTTELKSLSPHIRCSHTLSPRVI